MHHEYELVPTLTHPTYSSAIGHGTHPLHRDVEPPFYGLQPIVDRDIFDALTQLTMV